MPHLNAGPVGIFHDCEAMKDWFDRGCKIDSCQIYTFRVIDCMIHMRIAPLKLGRWIGYPPILIINLFVLLHLLRCLDILSFVGTLGYIHSDLECVCIRIDSSWNASPCKLMLSTNLSSKVARWFGNLSITWLAERD